MEWYETAFDRIYPVLYRRRDEVEAERVFDAFGDLLTGGEPILDLACGGGRYMATAARRGLQVWGVDLSSFLLGEAVTRKELVGRVVRADMRRLPFHDGTFGAVLNMFTSFGYFGVDMDNLMVFHEVSRVLRGGGMLLFDFLNAGRIMVEPPRDSEHETDKFLIRERRALESSGRFLVKQVKAVNRATGKTIAYDERVRLYTREDLMTMLDSVDLSVSGVFGDYDRGKFKKEESERIIMICEKQAGAVNSNVAV